MIPLFAVDLLEPLKDLSDFNNHKLPDDSFVTCYYSPQLQITVKK